MTQQSLLITLFSLLLLGGCQLTPNLQEPESALGANCFYPEESVSQFLDDEHLYVNAEPTQRKQMLDDNKNNPERLANLLSCPGNNRASLKKSLDLFNQLHLLPIKPCIADRYLYLRLRQTQTHLTIIEELYSTTTFLNAAQATIETQQQQIDALTQIEQIITRQREEP